MTVGAIARRRLVDCRAELAAIINDLEITIG
jgi:hypothetical protein